MKRFITKQRVLILLGGITASALSLGIAYIIGYTGLLGSLLVNFSAGAITIGITVIFVDYLLSEEKKRMAAPARMNAKLEIESVRLQLSSAIEILFRAYKDSSEQHFPEADDFVTPRLKNIDRLIKEKGVLKPNFKLHKKDIEVYADAVKNAVHSLDKIIGSFAHALLQEEREALFAFYPAVRSAESSMEAYKSLLKAIAKGGDNKGKAVEIGQEMIKMSVKLLLPGIRRGLDYKTPQVTP